MFFCILTTLICIFILMFQVKYNLDEKCMSLQCDLFTLILCIRKHPSDTAGKWDTLCAHVLYAYIYIKQFTLSEKNVMVLFLSISYHFDSKCWCIYIYAFWSPFIFIDSVLYELNLCSFSSFLLIHELTR